MTEHSRAGGEQSRGRSVVRWRWWGLLGVLAFALESAGVDLVVTGSVSPNPVFNANDLTYTIAVTNAAPDTATGVAITNMLSSRLQFVSASSTRGSCSNVSGVVYCDFGEVLAGAGGRITITAKATAPGTLASTVSAGAIEADANAGDNALTLTSVAINRRTFNSLDFIQMEEILSRPAVPYPSTITVSGLTAAVQKVTVTLNNVSHGAPDDMDVLLVGPTGAQVMLLSDGPIEPGITDVVLTFDDAASQVFPDTGAIATGTYRPANYGNEGDVLPAPAPAGPHLKGFPSLGIFNNTDPNGEWRLFVFDDEPEVGGWIDGWSLNISTMIGLVNLAVEVTDSPDPALPGDVITYTTTITNSGPVGATGVRVTNSVPAGFELISYSVTRGACTNAGGTVRCDVGTMAVGANEQMIVQARALNGGNYTNRVQVSSDDVDNVPGNNVAMQRTVVEPRVNLAVQLTSSRTPALLEQPLIYSLLVTNMGPDAATGVRLVDELPPGVLLANAFASQGSCTNDNGIVTCNLGTITNRGRATVSLTCRPTVLGLITNIVSVFSDQVDTDATNNVAQNENVIDPAADLLLTMTDAPDPVAVSLPLTYSIFVTNRGPSVASNVVVSDVLAVSLRLLSAQSTHGACTNDSNAVSCAIAELPPGERATVTITVAGTVPGSVVNSASVTSQPMDPNTGNNIAAVTTLLTPAADVSVTKVSERSSVWEGDRLVYNLVVSNSGPTAATGVGLLDTLPAGFNFISATPSTGSCFLQGSGVSCTFGTLPVGGRVTVSVVGTIGIAGTITNVANAFASEQDLNPSNNIAVSVTPVIPRSASMADTNRVVLPDVGMGPAYPLTIDVSGMTATVQRVRLALPGFGHTYPDDLDMLLVGPGGQAVIVMSDAGGSISVSNINLTLDDTAVAALPDASGLSSSHYQPANYEPEASEFPVPAPTGPYGSSFDVFTGTDPNGTWQLYIVDDVVKDNGVLGGGWRLDISTGPSMAEVDVSAQAAPEPVAVGSNVTVSVTVSNSGPGAATSVVLTNVYGPELMFNGAAASQGGCTNDAGLVHCAVGDIAVGGVAHVQISFTVLSGGVISNVVGVTASSVDFTGSNNMSTVSFLAEDPPTIVTQPQNRYVAAGGSATFEVVAAGTGPLSYQWYRNDAAIEGATETNLTINDVQLEALGEYRVEVSNRVAVISSEVARLEFPLPPVLDAIADQAMDEDQALTVPLGVHHPQYALEALRLSAACADTNLVPSTNFAFTLTGTNYALAIVPGTNQFGTNLFTVTVEDPAGNAVSHTFTLGVQAVNDYPQFVVPVGDVVMDEDDSILVPFVIGDAETDAAVLILGPRSYNQTVIQTIWIGFAGSSSNRYVWLTPNQNRHGTAVLEIRLRDEAGVRSTNLFNLTVLPVEDAPTISAMDDVTIAEDGELRMSFTVGDVESNSGDLLVSAESSNPALFANDAFLFDGGAAARELIARPVADQFGTARITVLVQDPAGMVSSNSFWVTVDPVNDGPFVSEIPEVVTVIEETSEPVSFTIGDLESSAESLVLRAISTNTVLAPLEGIQFGGSGSNRTVQVTPGAGEFGWTVLQVEVSDPDGGKTIREFELSVHPTNGPPLILRQPESQTVTLGDPARLRVVAKGSGGLLYQWQKDGQDLTDKTNSVLAIDAASDLDRGEYRVTVSNAEGSLTSNPAQLKVLETTRILTLRRVLESVELTFGTIAGLRYIMEFEDSVGSGWTALPEVTGTGEIMTVTDPTTPANSRFYRIRVE